MEVIMHEDSFEDVRVHTFAWGQRPAWLECEVHRVLGYAAPSIEDLPEALPGEDFDIVEGEHARELLARCDVRGNDPTTPVVVLYASGLALVCSAVHSIGPVLRRSLLGSAALVQETMNLASFVPQVSAVLLDAEVNLRRHKAAALLRLIESAQAHGDLENGALATAFACVAEIALGQRVRLAVHGAIPEQSVLRAEDVAAVLGAPPAWAASALDAIRTRAADQT